MLSKTLPALLLSLGLLAVPAASADHNRCSNEPDQDIWVEALGVGVDGPLLDGNGIQVCYDRNVVSVESTTDPVGTDGPIPPPPGTGVAVRVCHDVGTTQDECEGTILLDWTGVTVACSTPNSICVWVDGRTVIPLP